MSEKKPTVMLYLSDFAAIPKMTDEEAGKIFRAILAFSENEEEVLEDRFLKIIFEPIKNSLKKEKEKYEKICEKRRENGAMGGRPKANDFQENLKKPNGFLKKQKKPTSTSTSTSTSKKKEDIEIEDISGDGGEEIFFPKKSPPKKTPKEIAKNFFENSEEREAVVRILVQKGRDEESSRREIERFFRYWTEKNPSGKKEKWQEQKTFEIPKRLATWFENTGKWHSGGSSPPPKKGAMVFCGD